MKWLLIGAGAWWLYRYFGPPAPSPPPPPTLRFRTVTPVVFARADRIRQLQPAMSGYSAPRLGRCACGG